MTMRKFENLEEQAEYLNGLTVEEIDELGSELSSLQTFGGTEPEKTLGVWSWDEDNLLVGEGEFEIVSR